MTEGTIIKNLNDDLESIIEKKSLELENAHEQIIQKEKMLVVHKLIKDIAHSINTPLGVSITSASYIKNSVNKIHGDYLDNKLGKKKIEEFFKKFQETNQLMLVSLDKAANLIETFKMITRDSSTLKLEVFNVYDRVKNVIEAIGANECQIDIICENELEIVNYPMLFDIVLNNIVLNAIYHGYANKSGVIRVECKDSNNDLELLIADYGIGISKEVIDSFFTPFYDRKSSFNSGLGLSIVYHFLERIMNGSIEIDSKLKNGTVVRLIIANMKAKVEQYD